MMSAVVILPLCTQKPSARPAARASVSTMINVARDVRIASVGSFISNDYRISWVNLVGEEF